MLIQFGFRHKLYVSEVEDRSSETIVCAVIRDNVPFQLKVSMLFFYSSLRPTKTSPWFKPLDSR